MGSTPSPPAAPDPYQAAGAQAQANAGTATANAYLNNPNVNNPYGSSTTTQTGSYSYTNPDGSTSTIPQFTINQTLSPAQQGLLDQQNALSSQYNTIAGRALNSVGRTLSHPLTAGQFGQVQTGVGALPTLQNTYGSGQLQTGYDSGGAVQSSVPFWMQGTNAPSTFGNTSSSIQNDVNLNANAPTTFGQTRGAIQYGLGNTDFTADRDASTAAVLARLAPQMAAQQESLNSSLANQGTAQGSAAWNAAQLSQNQANNDLRLGAVQTGDAEQQALFGERLSAGQFNNAAQQQDYSQLLGRGQFAQQGIAQNNQATLDAGNFHNAAQQQDYSQILGRANYAQNAYGMNNAAIGANNSAALNAGNFANSAQAQQYGENAAQAAFYNSAVGQQAQMNQQLAAFSNQAGQQDYQNRLQAGAFNNSAIQQQIQQAMALQNQQINQIGALRSGGQVTSPQFSSYNPSQIDQTPISSDIYATAGLQNQQYMAQLQNQAANTQALGSAFGGLTSMFKFTPSDRRLKSNVTRIGATSRGLPVYSYDLAGTPGRQVGVMADEAALFHPEAVATGPGGYAMVDYSRIAA